MKQLTAIDCHAAGEPLRVITGGYPELDGQTMLDRRAFAREHHDAFRRALIWEPRGHADMYGCVLTGPASSDGDLGVLFLHNEGYSTMCGHGIIGLVTVGIEHGLIDARAELLIDTPAGRVTARPRLVGGRVASVSFVNVASFLLREDLRIGDLRCDVAFGGAFYAYVESTGLRPERYRELIEEGMRIKRAVADSFRIVHPCGDEGLNFLYGTILVEPLDGPIHSRNVCIFAEGELDRSPTGTGVSGRAAIHHARGELAVGTTITIESLIGTTFDVRILDTVPVGDLLGVIPEVTGSAFVTGLHEFLIDPEDPLGEGFFLR